MKQLGPYQILRRIGMGGTAEVFLATGPNPRNRELLALKVILPHLAEEDGLRAMMIKEARTSALLLHPNLVEVYEVGEVDGRPFMAMEFIAGWPVSGMEKKLKVTSERMPLEGACAIVHAAALGLHYAHELTDKRGRSQGLIHRDVSPQNIMVSQEGQVKVVDFGLAKVADAQGTKTGGIKGKLPYMPPEQLRAQGMDRRVDVFALGAVLWELCCGRLLYPGRSEAEIIQQALTEPQPPARDFAPEMPAELAAILSQAVERDVSRRTPTASALADALERWVPADAPKWLASWASTHFDAMPRTAGDALGLPPTPDAILTPPPRPARKGTGEHAKGLAPRIKARMDLGVDARTPSQPRMSRVKTPEPEAEPEPEEKAAPLPPPPAPRKSRTWLWVGLGVLLVTGGALGVRRFTAQDVESRPDVKPQALSPKGSRPIPAGARGTLVIESDVPAIVRENGTDLGRTPLTLSVLAGTHHLSVRTIDFREEVSVDVAVPEQSKVVKRVELEAP